MANLFEAAGLEKSAPRPLADRLRPKSLAEVVGQDHIVGPDGTLTRMLKSGRVPSLIFWGPPGSGKTTIARLLAGETNLAFEQLSAIFSGVAELRKAFDRAKVLREQGKGTLLFIDEIHRFNRSQQDSFLPHMEDGTITLVGATTENPSFELNAALLSRATVLTLNRLDDGDARSPSEARRSGNRTPAAARSPTHAKRSKAWPTATAAPSSISPRTCLPPCAQGQAARPRGARPPRAAARAALRQIPRRPLQPDLGAA